MNNKRMIKFAVWTIIVAAIVVGAVFIVTGSIINNYDSAGVGLTVDPDSGTFVEPEIEELENSSEGIAIPGWGSITVKAGETEVAVNLKNPEENRDRYDLTFTIILDGEEEALAGTGLIPAGKSALKLRLAKPLEPGTYDATVLVQPYRVDDGSKTNNAEIKTVIIAE